MPVCIVSGCKVRTSTKSSIQEEIEKKTKITFHAFPTCPTRRQLWQCSIGLENSVIPKRSVVCSLHFRTEDFDRTSLSYVRLKPGTIPYLNFPTVPKTECAETFNEGASCSSVEQANQLKSPTGSRKRSVDTISLDEPTEKVPKIVSPVKNECLPVLLETSESSTQVEISLIDQSTFMSPKRLFHSPRKEQLRKHIAMMEKKHKSQLKIIKQKNYRNLKKIRNLQTILQTLQRKNLLEQEQIDSLTGICGFQTQLFKRLANKSATKPVKRTYTPELRLFSLTLHYYSPRAYHYVRNKFGLCLPHAKTLYKWYKSVDGEPGFNNEAIRHIKEYNNTVQDCLFATLIIDEMAIRKHVEFDGERFTGVVNVGKAFACNEENVAKEALVFLLVGLNKSWKIPVGYFLIDKLNGEQKCNLVQQCLRVVHETGVRVVCFTCDGAANNIAMVKALGCNFANTNSLQTHFLHPITAEPIYFMLDPCHLIKLIRNTLGDYKCILNHKKKIIEWKYIVNLQELQEEEGLHLGNKLSKQHIHYNHKKMKVKYAVQVLSSSVSKAMYICRTDLQLEKFKNSEATEEFIQTMNDLFDIFNSRNIRQTHFNEPISSKNYAVIIKKLNNCVKYISKLSLTDGKKIIESQRKIGFLGFLICINSLKGLYKDICATGQVSHIPLYQCSQDHLELFFCCLRSFGRCNNNPTALQFKAAFKKLLVHNEVKSLDSANCSAVYNIPILHYSSATSDRIINSSTNETIDINSEEIQTEYKEFEDSCQITEYHSYSLPSGIHGYIYSEFTDRIIVYIAGWVVKKLSVILHCTNCVHSLRADTNETIHNLINIKDRGSLNYPSHDVIKICRLCEKMIKFYLIKKETRTASYMCNTILNQLDVHNLFLSIIDHSNEQIALYNHRIHLIKCIIQQYIKVRYHHIAKQKNNTSESKRTHFNKLVLFSGH